jgi:hypothetical protein
MGKRKSQKAVREKALEGANNPVVRAVIAKIPAVGSVLNDAMADKRSRLAEERFGTFIDELNKTGKVPTTEQLHGNSFAHAVLETTRAAVNAHREAKIRRFARLLSNYDRIVVGNNIDDYEELLGILNELTDKEFQILLLLRKHEDDDHPSRKRTVASMPYPYWQPFQRDAEAKGVAPNELQGYFQRLARTGCVYMITGSASGQLARTTPLFHRLVSVVERPDNGSQASFP